MRSMVAAGFVPPAQPLAARGLDVLGELVGTVGPVIAAAAVLGAAVGLRSDGRAAWKTLGAAALGCLGLVWLAPVPVDPRYTILAWPIAVLAAAYGLKAAAGKFLSDLRASQAAAAAIILAALAHGSLPRVYAKRPTAIETVAEDLLRRPELADRVWLVSSEAGGEVLFVGEVARREHPPSRYVLRASKLLARSSWQADGEYASLVDTESELASRLDEPPVSVVVLHESKPLREYRHHRLLRTLVRNRPEVWRPVAAYSDSEGEIHVYAADRQSTKPGTITLDMTLVLGKTLSGRAQPSPAAETKN